MIKINFIPFLS